MSLTEELKWRGLFHDMIPGTDELLKKEKVTAYIGFDPTAESLHIGSLVQIILLMHLQRHGHKPIALVGGATGMVGDPSFKSEERKMLSEETLAVNIKGIEAQLRKFIDFENGAELVNNYDWFKNFSLLDFLREVGKHITVNYMMSKDSVKKRLETGISFTEFSYQLIQGYDFYWLWKNKGAKLQMGGSDQWGNIVTGTELIRRMDGGEAFALTVPLVTKADGTKFGKTEQGNVWLDASLTSPYQFYQFWVNASDEDAEKYIRIFTFLPREEIESLIERHRSQPHMRELQKKLADEITTLVHGEDQLQAALAATAILFGQGTNEQLAAMDERLFLDVFEGVPGYEIESEAAKEGIPILDLLAVHTQVFPSKGEARKMIQQGALSLNKQKITDPAAGISISDFLNQKYLLVQKGKKQYSLISIVQS
ncbi:MAG: tyrosine--tRNA ligase [Bacteroidetes bacterium]|nr:tyrosine--tRNA ligase [Bacteroidota bacterium]